MEGTAPTEAVEEWTRVSFECQCCLSLKQVGDATSGSTVGPEVHALLASAVFTAAPAVFGDGSNPAVRTRWARCVAGVSLRH
jgi:hypothetical protein